MRLPRAKPYRAFIELDAFTDAECRHIVERGLRRQRLFVMLTGPLIAASGIAGLSLLIATIMLVNAEQNGARPRQWVLARAAYDVFVISPGVGTAAGISGAVAGAFIPPLLIRDRIVRRGIRRHLRLVSCPFCRASLMGASRTDRKVLCGCGAEHDLRRLGLDSTDLGPPLVVHGTLNQCRVCRYSLAGLPVHRGRVTCPECGGETMVAVNDDAAARAGAHE